MEKINDKSLEFDEFTYWINELSNSLKNERILCDYYNDNFDVDRYSININEENGNKLRLICKNNELAIYSFLVTTISISLYKYDNKQSSTIGIPCYTSKGVRNIVYSKVLPLTYEIDVDKTYKQYFISINKKIIELYKNQNYLDGKILSKFNLENIMELASLNIAMKDFHEEKYIDYICNSIKNEMLFVFNLSDNKYIELEIVYNSRKFSKQSIQNICSVFTGVLEDLNNNLNQPIKDINCLSVNTINTILYDFNDTKMDYQSDKTIQELFEAQVEKTPDNIAVIFDDKKLTYRELNRRANSLAKNLRTKGIKEDSIVGIMIDRSLEMITSIIGILKAGGAYLPIDPMLPKERINYILKDSGTEILLSKSDFIEGIEFDGMVIDLIEDTLFNKYIDNLEVINDSNNLAYVIYTSGTTGNPKGVMVEHRSLNNLILGLNKKIYEKYNKYLNVCLVAPYYFDASVQQIFAAILNGHSLYITDDYTRRDSDRLIQYYEENNIDISDGTPIHLKMMASSEFLRKSNVQVKEYIIGGEELPLNTVKEFYNKLRVENKPVINNVYGPTECCVDSSIYKINNETISGMESIPIGEPMVNYKLYILDKFNKVVPIGVSGELHISGDGLARGYLNKPELTAEKFVDNPFEPGTKMYKTGDLARWLQDGNIEFLGRIDNQVKIRGFRIELGEIESKILQHEDVKEATVIVIDGKDNDKHICSYIVSDKEISELSLRDYLTESLPEYMVPSYFVKVDKMPITSNGKLDRRALPKPNLDEKLTSYEAPRNDLEETLARVWSEVLGIEKIGINDNFFELGGHSLKAMTLISKIHKETNKELSLKELFKRPTIKGISKFIDEAKDNIFYNIAKLEDKPHYETSSAQKRMYIIQGINKESIAYNMPQIFEIEGIKDKNKIEETFKKLISRHEALRTYFETIEGEIVQKIDVDYEFRLKERLENKTIDEIENDFVKPFDLRKAPLFRAEIVEIHEKTYLLLDMHHIISDGVSMNILINEFATLYNGGALEPLKLQYTDFAEWQNNFLKSEELKNQEEYWINMLKDEIPVLNMPIDYERTAVQSFEGGSVSFEVDKNVGLKLKELTTKTGTTMHMVLLSAFNILLAKYSGQEDIVVGTPIAGRYHADLQNIIGMFVNTLALRNKPEGTKRYLDFLNEVKENSLKAYENQSYQLETLIEKLDIVRDTSRSPLFDVMFNMVDTVSDLGIKINDMSLIPYGSESSISKFDLTLNAMEQNGEINISIEYCSKLFNKNSIERLGKYYLTILDIITTNSEIKLGEIQLVSDEEKNLILNKFNYTKMDYQSDKTIQELFEAQVEKTPDNIAVIFDDKKLTYRELNKRANSLAKNLRTKGIKEDSIVGIMIDRSLEMITSIIGILKAGGAYLPIDPMLPKERINYILKDSGTEILLSKSDFIEGIEFDGMVIDLIEDTLFNKYIDNLEVINDSNNLAYVIYTSGTTGNPKGVMVEHRSLNNLILGLNKKIYGKYNKYLNVCLVAPYYFDASVQQIFAAILNGHSLYITDDYTRRDSNRLIQYYEENNIDISDGTPIHLKMMASSEFLRKSNVQVKEYIIGGEELPLNTVKEFYSKLRVENKPVINNVYGPTECCVDSSIYTINDDLIDCMKFMSIGKPMVNYKLYILDRYNKLVPIGVPGELYISGEGIARGYLNNSQLTEMKFIDNPFEIGTKMYKTGDLVKWLADGNIEFLGRVDNQVKIRGFRIELGEIESKILKHEDVKETTVMVIDGKDNDKHICSYIVSDKEISELSLRDYLTESLPEYMIPSYFVKVDKMPITSNGKLDRRALPKPNLDEKLTSYEAPTNDLEETLARVWSEVLGIEKIGINDNFFELGGHSLKAMTLISKIHKETNKELSLKELFKRPTIKGISKFIDEAKDNVFYNIAKLEDKPYYETSSAQKRMYIIQGINKESIAYNMPQIYEIEGIKDRNKIEEIFKKLISRHEALRTYFETIEGGIVQKIDNDYEFRLKERLENKAIDEIENDFVKPFDLGKAPLFRAEIVEMHEKTYLLLDMHHIISDGVSMSILMDEFERLYNGQELQPLSIQYKDFAAWQNNFLKTEAIRSQEEYWINIFKDNIPVLELPYDYERTSIKSLDGSSIEFEIDSVVTNKLKQLARKTETTMHMIILSAFTILLSKYSGQEDIIIGVPISGRRHSDVQNIMGVFINTLALRNKPKGDKTFIEFLTEVKENSLKAYDNQDYQLETLIQKLDIVREQSRNPLFDVIFNTLNIEGETVKLNEITLTPIISENKTAKFDLNLSLVEDMNNLQLNFIYCKDLFNKESIEIMRDDFIDILNKISENCDMLLQNMCKSEVNCKKNIEMNDEFCF